MEKRRSVVGCNGGGGGGGSGGDGGFEEEKGEKIRMPSLLLPDCKRLHFAVKMPEAWG